jgi:hypothetical protein
MFLLSLVKSFLSLPCYNPDSSVFALLPSLELLTNLDLSSVSSSEQSVKRLVSSLALTTLEGLKNNTRRPSSALSCSVKAFPRFLFFFLALIDLRKPCSRWAVTEGQSASTHPSYSSPPVLWPESRFISGGAWPTWATKTITFTCILEALGARRPL